MSIVYRVAGHALFKEIMHFSPLDLHSHGAVTDSTFDSKIEVNGDRKMLLKRSTEMAAHLTEKKNLTGTDLYFLSPLF